MTQGGRSTSHGAGLLEQWLQNPLDEGYAEAAARKAAAGPTAVHRPVGRRRDGVWTAAGCLLIGLLLIVAYLEANRDAPTDARTRADLRTRISQAQKDGDNLERTAADLDRKVAAGRAAAIGSGSNTELTKAEAQAGTTAVRGPGIRVVMGNPSAPTGAAGTGRAGTTPIGAISVLTDTDVRAVVNELWLDGAEAISVNTIRLTPISAIRFAGQAVLVDFQPITSPYTIEAIGDSNQLITALTDSPVASKYRTLASANGFAFRSDQVERITMVANVLSQPKYASIPTATATPSATATP
ncbi:MAG: hypothetical protein JWM76_3497, partial [Pseudonocardiales bacterium]|nr:hypothetical protein [Pseudonocardiales bacterium]